MRLLSLLFSLISLAVCAFGQTAQTFNFDPANPVFPVVTVTPVVNTTAPTVLQVGPIGSTTWSYAVVAVQPNPAYHTAASPAGSVLNGAASLSASQYNVISWPVIAGATTYDVYRTVVGTSPTTTGKINTSPVTTNTFTDAGQNADGSTPPSTNTTGGGSFQSITPATIVGPTAVTGGSMSFGVSTADPVNGLLSTQPGVKIQIAGQVASPLLLPQCTAVRTTYCHY